MFRVSLLVMKWLMMTERVRMTHTYGTPAANNSQTPRGAIALPRGTKNLTFCLNEKLRLLY